MENFHVRYHIVGNRVVSDVKEFESFNAAVISTSNGLKNEVISIVRNDKHVVEIQTKNITYHEVMSEDTAKKEREMTHISNLASSIFN